MKALAARLAAAAALVAVAVVASTGAILPTVSAGLRGAASLCAPPAETGPADARTMRALPCGVA